MVSAVWVGRPAGEFVVEARRAFQTGSAPTFLRALESEIDGTSPRGLVAIGVPQGRDGEINRDQALRVTGGPLIKVFEGRSRNMILNEQRVTGMEGVKIGFGRIGMMGSGLPVMGFKIILNYKTGRRRGPKIAKGVSQAPFGSWGDEMREREGFPTEGEDSGFDHGVIALNDIVRDNKELREIGEEGSDENVNRNDALVGREERERGAVG